MRYGLFNPSVEQNYPKIWLMKPDKTVISRLSEIEREAQLSVEFGKVNEISFTLPLFVEKNNETVPNKNARQLKNKYLLKIEFMGEIEHHVIEQRGKEDQDTTGIPVTAYSLQYELNGKKIYEIEETSVSPEYMLDVLLKDTGWKRGSISPSIAQKLRSYNIANSSVTDGLYQVAEAIGAIIDFDTVKQEVNMIDENDASPFSGLKLNEKNYIESLQDNYNSETIVTRLFPIGSEGLTINSVNPTGTAFIEDFSYYLYPFERDEKRNIINHSWYMSDELAHAMLDYQEKVKKNGPSIKAEFQSKETLENEIMELQLQLSEKELDRDVVEDRLDILRSLNQYHYFTFVGNKTQKAPLESGSYFAQYRTKKGEARAIINGVTHPHSKTWSSTKFQLTNKQDISIGAAQATTPDAEVEIMIVQIPTAEYADTFFNLRDKYNAKYRQDLVDGVNKEITNRENQILTIESKLETLFNDIALENNFSPKLLAERTRFTHEEYWIEENHIEAQELYDDAVKQFNKINKPERSLSVSIVNFLSLLEEERNWDKLKLGHRLSINHKKLDIKSESILTAIQYDFSSDSISLTISDTTDVVSDEDKLSKLLYEVSSSSSYLTLKKYIYDEASQKANAVEELLQGTWDATKRRIVAGTNESVDIGKRGIVIRSARHPNDILIQQAGVIAISNDGGQTFKNALTTEGLVAERIFGRMIIGQNLWIEDENGIVSIKGDLVEIKDANGDTRIQLGQIEPGQFGARFYRGSVEFVDGLPKNQIDPDAVDAWDNAEENAKTHANNLKNQTDAQILSMNTAITNLENTMETTFKDGVLDEAELLAIKSTLDAINREKVGIDNRYKTIYTNANLLGTPKSNLYNIKKNYDMIHDQLLNSIQNAIRDKEVSDTEKTQIETNMTNYVVAIGALAEAFEIATNAIALQFAESAKNSAFADAKTFVQEYANKKVTQSPTEPPLPSVDDLWINTSVKPNTWHRWDGTAWRDASATKLEDLSGILEENRVKIGSLTEFAPGYDPSMKASYEDLNAKANQTLADAQTKIDEANTTLRTEISEAAEATKADADTKLTAARQELQTEIGKKADTTWLSGQLADKADKSGVYTKTEVDTALKGKVSTTTYTTDKNGIIERLGTAETNISQTADAILSKAEKTELDTVSGVASSAKTTAEQTAEALKSKAETSTVNTLTGRVESAETTISQHATAISSKASQSSVNTLTGRVDSAESTITQQAKQIASKVDETFVRGAIDGIQFGGRNLVQGSNTSDWTTYGSGSVVTKFDNQSRANIKATNTSSSTFGIQQSTLQREKMALEKDADYTLSFKIRGTIGLPMNYVYIMNSGSIGNESLSGLGVIPSETDFTRVSTTFKKRLAAPFSYIMISSQNGLSNGAWFEVKEVQIEKGNKATDWNEAPEDIQSQINTASSLIEQNAKEIAQRVTNTEFNTLSNRVSTAEGSITTMAGQITAKADKTVTDGLTTRVGTAEQIISGHTSQIASKVAQTDFNALTGRVETAESSITQQGAQIELKVGTSTFNSFVESQMNLIPNPARTGSTEGWTLSSGGVHSIEDIDFFGVLTPSLAVRSTASTQVYSPYFDVDPAKAYEVTMWLKSETPAPATTNAYVGLHASPATIEQVTSSNGVVVDNTNFYFYSYSGETHLAEWTKITGYILPAGFDPEKAKGLGDKSQYNARMKPTTKKMRVRWLNWANTSTTPRTMWMTNSSVREVPADLLAQGVRQDNLISSINLTPGTALIDFAKVKVNGEIESKHIKTGGIETINLAAEAVTAEKVAANSIASSHISTVGLDAGVVKFGTMSGQRIQAGTIDADRLNVKTLSAISANIGNVTAGTITGVTIKGSTVEGVRLISRYEESPDDSLTTIINAGTITQSFTSTSLRLIGSINMSATGITIQKNSTDGEKIGKSGKIDFNASRIAMYDYLDMTTAKSYWYPDRFRAPTVYADKFMSPGSVGDLIISSNSYGTTLTTSRIGFQISDDLALSKDLKVFGASRFYDNIWSSGNYKAGTNGVYSTGVGYVVLRSEANEIVYLQGSQIRATAPSSASNYVPITASEYKTSTSVREMKTDIEVYEEDVLTKMKNSKVYLYFEKNSANKQKKQLGVMVDETDPVIHSSSNDSINLYAMGAYNYRGIQQLALETDEMRKLFEDEINRLKIEIQILKQSK